jgi:hypothetical protein
MRKLGFFLLAIAVAAGAQTQRRPANPFADSMERKLQYIEQNGGKSQPNPAPTILSEQEVNAWFASSYASLPKGVRSLKVVGMNGDITANASIDFDAVKEGRGGGGFNPLMSMFSGVHDVQVVATAQAQGGEAQVHVKSASIDDVNIPRIALEFFIDHYLKPKYPNVGMDTTFSPGYRVDSATVGRHQISIVQK